ncbi:cytochrome C [Chryseobacterium phosphatilyticum]|uniref:Cytochrome C n=1 Tax=Chryseobacterium phosphatilyticum TaxID=475075 RepID=A0A316XJP2_9FLAO|nr:heme-binding domain-containing protein [Chryseobacterium phosphatilyticum]PWN71638.1 cytochrome C [Chryseobacterium phosphatilyticum]
MNQNVKKILFGCILIFLMIQLIRPARNIDYGQLPSSDISKVYQIPEKIQSILRNSCYDCHSNSTDYPVYSYIQPLSFYLENHIQKGKKELNFNEWGHYSDRKQANKLESILNQIQQKKMPLPSYIYLHHGAKLSEKQIEEMASWIGRIQAENGKAK